MHAALSASQLAAHITGKFRVDIPAPVILLGEEAAPALTSAVADLAAACDRPFTLLPGPDAPSRVEQDALACLSLSAHDLALAARALVVPHGPGAPQQIQRAQSVLSSLRAAQAAARSVLALTFDGLETSADMNLALSMLLEPQEGLDLTHAPVFWCVSSADKLPTAYRNKCEVFTLATAPRPRGP